MAVAQRITSWSFSRWNVYNTCPAQAKYKFIDKLPEPGSPAMDRGSAIHKGVEQYILGAAAKPPADAKAITTFTPMLRSLRAQRKKDP